MDLSDSIAEHVSKVESLAKHIRETGDSAIMTKILSSWLSLDDNKHTISNLTARLLDDEVNLEKYEVSDTALATLSSKKNKRNSRSQTICYNCRKRGHITKYCKAPKNNNNNN